MPKKNIHTGLQTYRFRDNPEERRFAEKWKKENEHGRLLAYLLHVGATQHAPLEPSVRDAAVAATVIQWLGSPVGQIFLRDLGYGPVAKIQASLDQAIKETEKARIKVHGTISSLEAFLKRQKP